VTESVRVPMRSLPPDEAVKTWDQVLLGYDRPEASAEARRSLAVDLTPATEACPFHVDVPQLAERIAAGDFDGAAAMIAERHPFPQVMGMHCHRPCELALFRASGGEYVQRPGAAPVRASPSTPYISALEWAAGRYGTPPPFVPGPPTGRRVAIVGAGSGSLACAWELRRLGHAVEIFDLDTVPGGLLWTGYPSFRMDKGVVKRENDPEAWGAVYHGGHPVDSQELLRLADEFDAVYIGIGRSPLRSFGVEGEDLEGVITGMDLLRETWYGRPPKIGPRVLVFGGGSAAFDTSRTARRLGCEVTMVYRRGPDEMPAGGGATAIRGLAEEGIDTLTMTDLKRIVGEQGRVVAAEVVDMAHGDPDEHGRRTSHPVPETEHLLPADTIIRSIGEIYEVQDIVEPAGIKVKSTGFIEIDLVTRQTAHPRIWAGGDVTGGRANHGAAWDGMWAARAMDASFNGRLEEFRDELAGTRETQLVPRDRIEG
jgi:NADPH-dependent glutamate synthase beta subunit-like oxidoreductase